MKNCISEMSKSFSSSIESLQDFDLLKSIFNKMRVLSDELREELNSQIPDLGAGNLITILNAKREQSSKTLNQILREGKFENVAVELTRIYKITVLLSSWSASEAHYAHDTERLVNYIAKETDTINPLLDPDYPRDEKKIKLIKEWYEKLHLLQESFNESYHPIKEIKEISETFANRVKNLASKLGDKINTELRRRIQADFTKIEAWFTTLSDLKATQIIGIRIHPIYSTSLDSICIELREYKRSVENDMISLLQNSSLPVDIEQLRKYLSILGQAKWINKFYEGICDEVTNDINKQILIYAQNVQNSVKNMKISVKNSEKIRIAYEMVSKLKSMQPLEYLVKGLANEIDNTANWFSKIVLDSLASIQADYSKENFEKLKKEENFEQKLFDASKAERSIKFVRECSDYFPIEYEKTNTDLANFLKKYFIFVRDEILELFNEIVEVRITQTSEEKKQIREMRKRVEKIEYLFCEVKEMDEKHPTLKEFYPNGREFVSYIVQRFFDARVDLEEEIDREYGEKNTEIIKSILPVFKALSPLDGHITNGEKFSEIFKKYQGAYLNNISEAEKDAIAAFEKCDFNNIVAKIKELEDTNPGKFERVKKELGKFLEDLMDESRNKAASLRDELPMADVRNIIKECLRILKAAKEAVTPRKYYQRPELLDECMDEIHSILADRLKKHVDKLRKTFVLGDLTDAVRKINHVSSLKEILKHTLKKSELEKIDEIIKWYEKDAIKELTEKYKSRDFDAYQEYPPKNIFVSQADHPNDEQFEVLKKEILKTFDEELKEYDIYIPLSPNNKRLKKVQVASEYLPDKMKESINRKVENIRSEITARIEENLRKLEVIKTSDDLKEIEDVLTKFEKCGQADLIDETFRRIVGKIRELNAKISQKFTRAQIEASISKCTKASRI